MNKADIDKLTKQVNIINSSQKASEDLYVDDPDLQELQEAIIHHALDLQEVHEFFLNIARGNVNAEPPRRQNYLAGYIKELQAGLKHLTWQAEQVAKGKYNHRVSFLGDFSKSFNKMIEQLAEREEKLKQQSLMFKEASDLLKAIMDGQKDWIIVSDKETGEVIYTNQSARQMFYDVETRNHVCEENCGLLKHITNPNRSEFESMEYEYKCPLTRRIMLSRSYMIEWNGRLAYAHYITDISHEKEYQRRIKDLAYRDPLTGIYNRRYCMKKLEGLISKGMEFSLCLVDMDNLKRANDNYGHAEGDRYILTVSEQLQAVAGDRDYVCRIGGDEFVLIFPEAKASIVEQKMAMVDRALKNAKKDYPMSVSCGVVHIEEDSDIEAETVIEEADSKMYIVKKLKKI